jgi:RNA polymerase sigma factor
MGMRELDQMAVAAARDSQKLDKFIVQHEFFILKSASKTTKNYVSKNDDEWSVALVAFSEAVKKYDYSRGSFISFAELRIRSSLIDYYRAQSKYNTEVQVDWIEDHAIIEHNDNNVKLEIEAIGQVLEVYGFSFMDLARCSPKAKKTRSACGKSVVYLLDNPILVKEMRNSKLLPIKILESKVEVPRKILERHRKYIIAATEILYGDYPYLSEYLSCIKEEAKR